jgi:integrase
MPHPHNGPMIEAQIDEELDLFAEWLRNGEQTDRRRRRKAKSPDTARLYRERVGHILRRVGSLEADADTLRKAFVAWMKEPTRHGRPANDSTVRRSYYALRSWAQFKDVDLGDPKKALEAFDVPPDPFNPRGDDAVMEPELVRLFFARLAQVGDRRNFAVCRVLLRGGPRRMVIAKCRVKHFDHAARAITVPDEISKGGRGGVFIVDPVTADAVKDYLETRWDHGADPEAPLFHSYLDKGFLSPGGVTRLVARLTEQLLGKDERRTPHDLRHTCITFLANGIEGKPMPPAQLARQVFHSRISTTLRYTHPTGNPRQAYDESMGLA